MWALAVLLLGAITATVLIWPRRRRDSPPGPTPTPLIGTVAFAGAKSRDDIFEILLTLPKRFGPVVGFFAGSVYNVYVEGLDVARRAMAHPAANGRATEYAQLQLSFGKKRGVIAAEGDRWQRNSRFLLNTLDLMLKSGEIERMIMEELSLLTMRVRSQPGSTNIASIFRQQYVSLSWKIITGDSLSSDQVRELTDMFQAEMTAFQNSWVNSQVTSRIFPEKSGLGAVLRFREKVRSMFIVSLNKIEADSHTRRTFIEEFRSLHEVSDFQNSKDKKWSAEEDEDLVMFVFDFLNAGCETTSAFAEWATLYLLRHPDQQAILHREIEALGRPVRAGDLPNMPRVQAFMAEVFRRSSLTPAGVPHRATEDLHIEGYLVPRDTVLRYGILADHWSSELWSDPDQFKPERFLDESGRFSAVGELSHYGIGPRICTGRRLADVYNFLTLTHLLQNFELRVPEGCSQPPEASVMGLVRSCRPFQVAFQPQKDN